MKQIRKNVFETNSSSTHSLTMMMKNDYVRWQQEKLYLCNERYGWSKDNAPIIGDLYTKDEVIEFVKTNRWYSDGEEIDDDFIRECGFILWDDQGSDYLESFYEEFTTPKGETIIAFGEYGYDG